MRFGAGVLRFGRVAVVAASMVSIAGQGAFALSDPELPPDEDARLALIDYCVVQESGKHGQYDNFVDTCKCATNRLMSEMNQDEMAGVAKWRKPTSAVKKRWEAAWAACN